MAPGVLIFTGAPLSAALNWEESGLLDTFCEPIARFAGLDRNNDGSGSFVPATAETTASFDSPFWRSIPLERQHLATGLSQLHGYGKEYEGAAFFAASDIDSFVEELFQQPFCGQASSLESVEQVLSQFYEQSYVIHEDIPSSHIAATAETSTSFYTNESSSYGTSVDSVRGKEVPVAGHLTNLKDIPNARYLNSIYPQTMTVNLIIGIISIPPSRAIKTRRGADVELIEVLVGDETKSGFGVNIWLSSSARSAEGDLRGVLDGLRPQDVVLIRNLALSSFRGKVYGQSLRNKMTKVHLLYRSRIDKTDVSGCYNTADLAGENSHPQVEKTRRVREWVVRFIGTGPGARKGKHRAEAIKEVLPPDTQ
jgi:hypothetical protein